MSFDLIKNLGLGVLRTLGLARAQEPVARKPRLVSLTAAAMYSGRTRSQLVALLLEEGSLLRSDGGRLRIARSAQEQGIFVSYQGQPKVRADRLDTLEQRLGTFLNVLKGGK